MSEEAPFTLITRVHIQLAQPGQAPLLAIIRLVLTNGFTVKGLKLFQGHTTQIVCMPSHLKKRLCYHCKKDIPKNEEFCSKCGTPQEPLEILADDYQDQFHPILPTAHHDLKHAILKAHGREKGASKSTGYEWNEIPQDVVEAALAEFQIRYGS